MWNSEFKTRGHHMSTSSKHLTELFKPYIVSFFAVDSIRLPGCPFQDTSQQLGPGSPVWGRRPKRHLATVQIEDKARLQTRSRRAALALASRLRSCGRLVVGRGAARSSNGDPRFVLGRLWNLLGCVWLLDREFIRQGYPPKNIG